MKTPPKVEAVQAFMQVHYAVTAGLLHLEALTEQQAEQCLDLVSLSWMAVGYANCPPERPADGTMIREAAAITLKKMAVDEDTFWALLLGRGAKETEVDDDDAV